MLKVWGRTSSINVRKVLWTADEIGLVYEHDGRWATSDFPSTSPEFLKLNPNGLVPVIEDENGVLPQSNAICRYLAGRHGRDDLLPAEPAARARVETWMDWQATDLHAVFRAAFLGLVRPTPGYVGDTEAIARSFTAWTGKMLILEDQLARTGAHVAGEAFTLADILMGLAIHRYRRVPLERPQMPVMDAYVARLAERPAFARYTQHP